MITFGPVPSRRLGRSLGINTIPPKVCSYSCVYCQVGRTLDLRAERRAFYEPEDVLEDTRCSIKKAGQAAEAIDYLTIVSDGEPTLDKNLGRIIDVLKPLGIKIAVITNGSLMWREDVRAELMDADWVSLKVDSVIDQIWRKTNRPHKSLQLDSILRGMLRFGEVYRGELVTETMLVRDMNDGEQNLKAVADFLSLLKPVKAYLSIPTRPPAESSVHPPDEQTVNKAYQIFSGQVSHVAYLIGYEGDAFASTGHAEEDLMNIIAVHPMREDAVKELVAKTHADWSSVLELVDQGRLIEAEYGGHRFYVRRFNQRKTV